MNESFRTDAQVDLPAIVHARGCRCALHSRRLFTGGLIAAASLPALAREGVDVGKQSTFTKLVSAEQVEQAAAAQYGQMRPVRANGIRGDGTSLFGSPVLQITQLRR